MSESTSSTFWAKKTTQVTSPHPIITQSTPNSSVSPKPVGFVLKGMANGFATNGFAANGKVTNGKKTDWADSDDDDDFIASIVAQKDPRITTLENAIDGKDARIGELEAKIVTKELRIEELEATVEEKAHDIAELEQDLEDQIVRLETLSHDNIAKQQRVEEFVAEVDEKDRRIATLEAELDKKAAIILNLEMESDSQTQVSTEDTETREIDHDKSDGIGAATGVQNTTSQPVEANTAIPNVAPEKDLENAILSKAATEPSASEFLTAKPLTTEPIATETPKNDAPGPVFGKTDFPTFVTRDTVKVAPPAPKPKTLTFPIDTSKYKKQATHTTFAKHIESKKGRDAAPAPWGEASKLRRAKTNTVPKITPSLDIRQMSHAERVLFANGADVTVMLGNTKLATLPKYLLMQCSGKAYKYFNNNQDASSITFPAGVMDAEAAKAHLAWMDEMTYQGRVYSITLNADPKYDLKNVKICQAARVMGLNNSYVGHFTKQLCDRIRDRKTTMEFMELICEHAVLECDPVFECLANIIVNQYTRNDLQKPEPIQTLLSKYEPLKTRVEGIEKRTAGKRKDNDSRDPSKSRGLSKDRNGGGGHHGAHGRTGAGNDTKPGHKDSK